MSWDAIITGELNFPPEHIEKWRAAEGVLPRHRWPEFLGGTVDDDFDQEEDDPEALTVAGRIRTQQVLCGSFFVDAAGDKVQLRALVGKDEFWGTVNDVLRMVGAALPLGASGSVVRYAGGGWGHDDGAILRLENGALASEAIPSGGAPLGAADFALMEELMARVAQTAAAAAARKENALTQKPATQKPATQKPATQKPATKKPATKKPATKKPATKKPATKKPATKKPATKKPATKKPAIKKPAIKKPAIKKPAIQKPAIKKPARDRFRRS